MVKKNVYGVCEVYVCVYACVHRCVWVYVYMNVCVCAYAQLVPKPD